MLSSALGGLLTLAALGNLNLAALPFGQGASEPTISVEICGETGRHVIPIGGKVPVAPRRDCITACHAPCSRRKSLAAPE